MDPGKLKTAVDKFRELYSMGAQERALISRVITDKNELKLALVARFKMLVGAIVLEARLATIDERQEMQCALLATFTKEAQGETEEIRIESEQHQMSGICPLLA